MEIDYSEIDERCRKIVRVFNCLGLETEFSCSGHSKFSEFYILFSDTVQDKDIKDLLYNIDILGKNMLGQFSKWMRCFDGVFMENWRYSFPNDYCELCQEKPEDIDASILNQVLERSHNGSGARWKRVGLTALQVRLLSSPPYSRQ